MSWLPSNSSRLWQKPGFWLVNENTLLASDWSTLTPATCQHQELTRADPDPDSENNELTSSRPQQSGHFLLPSILDLTKVITFQCGTTETTDYMTRGGEWQKPDEIKRLNDTKQFYYTAEYQAGTQLFLLRVLCAILFWWHKNISQNDSKTSHLVLRSWVDQNFSSYSYIRDPWYKWSHHDF